MEVSQRSIASKPKKTGKKHYSIDQCRLYKIGSKTRLAHLLGMTLRQLVSLAGANGNYKEFLLPEEICPFTKSIRKARMVQAPKFGLKNAHLKLLKYLAPIIVPDYVHGATKGRSYLSNAETHKGAARVATLDIRKFYPSTHESRVFNFFAEKLLCAPDVAALLTRLTCFKGSLPTGSPLSPLLSFFANMPMFDELEMLAKNCELKFTCYIDDLTFSGPVMPRGLVELVRGVVERNGHKLSDEKTRLFRHNQYRHITGVALDNAGLLVPNSRFHKIRAIAVDMKCESNLQAKIALARKLSGVLGEAAYIDGRYSKWANLSYREISTLDCKIHESKRVSYKPRSNNVGNFWSPSTTDTAPW